MCGKNKTLQITPPTNPPPLKKAHPKPPPPLKKKPQNPHTKNNNYKNKQNSTKQSNNKRKQATYLFIMHVFYFRIRDLDFVKPLTLFSCIFPVSPGGANFGKYFCIVWKTNSLVYSCIKRVNKKQICVFKM